jgi:hypothetical protein
MFSTTEAPAPPAANKPIRVGPLCFQNSEFLYDPFPVGVCKPAVDEEVYGRLIDSWPPTELFQYKPKLGHKYSLSEINNPDKYHDFLASCPPWRDFYDVVKRPEFVQAVLETLAQNQIDLGLRGRHVSCVHRFSPLADKLKAALKKLKRLRAKDAPLSTRFEFSMLPADGGHIKPHTDAPQKLITLVLSVVPQGEWDPAWGGGTSMLRPKDMTKNFNFLNKQMEFDELEPFHTYAFAPNQCLMFVKTFNSFHCVYPMTARGSQAMRKTLTINIESWA